MICSLESLRGDPFPEAFLEIVPGSGSCVISEVYVIFESFVILVFFVSPEIPQMNPERLEDHDKNQQTDPRLYTAR